MNIYGSIGYTILKNENHYIIIFADMHDLLKECKNNVIISEWIYNKFNSSYILLEEVERIKGIELGEIWGESIHTQKLKELYLNNKNNIIPIDIRPFLIPFSWELKKNSKITLYNYLMIIDNFFCIEDLYIKGRLKYYDKKLILLKTLGKHFMALKYIYYNILIKYYEYINKYLYEIDDKILLDINELLDFIMEWYICSNINSLQNKSNIVHTGLAHSENIIILLTNIYNYKIIYQYGTNYIDNINDNNINGCVKLIDKYNKLFG